MKKDIKTTAATTGILVFLVIAVATTATAQVQDDDQDESTVTVSVASKIAVDISPGDLSYTGSAQPSPGDQILTDDNGFTAVEIENIGSENVSQVWMNNSVPSTNPFGSGTSSSYDAGNFVQINATGEIPGATGPDDEYSYVTRKDFNESNDLSYIFTNDNEPWRYGRFRAGDQEFFWAVNASSGTCDGTSTPSAILRVGQSAHNQTNTGTFDFTDSGTDYYERTITGSIGDGFGLATDVWLAQPDGTNRTYDVLTNCGDPTFTLRTSYNPKAGGASDLTFDGTQTRHLLNATTQEEELQPGEHLEVGAGIEVPQGVATGQVSDGTLAVVANSLEG